MPDNFWRKELWHPVTVHFPIALLLVATAFLLISLFIRKNYQSILFQVSFILLVLGSIGGWISVYTGDIADGVVARKICDPTILKDHEIAAKISMWIFSSAAVIHLFLFLDLLKNQFYKISHYVIVLLALTGAFYLIRAGHLGATLVYEQGAAVNNQSADCDE